MVSTVLNPSTSILHSLWNWFEASCSGSRWSSFYNEPNFIQAFVIDFACSLVLKSAVDKVICETQMDESGNWNGMRAGDSNVENLTILDQIAAKHSVGWDAVYSYILFTLAYTVGRVTVVTWNLWAFTTLQCKHTQELLSEAWARLDVSFLFLL